jgi:diaminopimelate decarboxylase
MKANPMPAVVGLMAGLVDGIDVASAGELKVALDAGADPAEISFAGPGKRDPELRQAVAARVLVNVESARELPVLAPPRRSWAAGAGGRARQPRLRAQGLGHEDGRRPQAVRHRRRAGARGAARIAGRGLAVRGLPPVRRLAEPARRGDLRGAAQVLRAGAAAGGEARRRRCASSTWAAASASRTSRASSGWTWRRSAPTWPLSSARRARCRRPARHRARPLLRRRGGRLRHARGRPQGVARPGVPGVRRRPEPPPVGVGQLRPGGAQELPGDHRQPADGAEREVASVVGPLCTPLDLLADRMDLPQAQVGDLVVVFQSGAYGASASPHSSTSSAYR